MPPTDWPSCPASRAAHLLPLFSRVCTSAMSSDDSGSEAQVEVQENRFAKAVLNVDDVSSDEEVRWHAAARCVRLHAARDRRPHCALLAGAPQHGWQCAAGVVQRGGAHWVHAARPQAGEACRAGPPGRHYSLARRPQLQVRGSRRARVHALLTGCIASRARWTIFDEYNDEEIVLNAREVELLRRVQAGQFPHPEHDPYPVGAPWSRMWLRHGAVADACGVGACAGVCGLRVGRARYSRHARHARAQAPVPAVQVGGNEGDAHCQGHQGGPREVWCAAALRAPCRRR